MRELTEIRRSARPVAASAAARPAKRALHARGAAPDLTDTLRAELAAIRERVRGELGERDARYIRRVLALQRSAEIAGHRGLLIGGLLPPLWVSGVALLALSKVLENMESATTCCTANTTGWAIPRCRARATSGIGPAPQRLAPLHNFVHHTFTNIVGKDRDVGYGLLRMADDQPWHPANLPQPLYAALQMVAFEWAVAVHDLELDAVLGGRETLGSLWRRSRSMRKKALRQVAKDFVLFPLLAGPLRRRSSPATSART